MLPGSAQADTPDADTVQALIVDRAAAHGISPNVLMCVAGKESRFSPSARGSRGERGVVQWMPGRGNAWDETSAYRLQGIDIIAEYERGNPDAIFFDVDMAAEMFAKNSSVRRWHWHSTIVDCE